MKKIIIFLLLFIFICFSIPIIFTSKTYTVNTNVDDVKENKEVIIEATYDYKKYAQIQLLHAKTKKIEINYENESDLNRILEIINFNK